MAVKSKHKKRVNLKYETITLPDGRKGIFLETDIAKINQYKITITKKAVSVKRAAKRKTEKQIIIDSLKEIARIKKNPNYKETHSLDKYLDEP